MIKKRNAATGFVLLAITGLLSGCHPAAPSALSAPAPAPAPTPAPIVTKALATALQSACPDRDGRSSWDTPAPPAKIHGSTYYVGTCGIAAVLIDTTDGLVLIDAATEKGGPAVAASINALGFDPSKIRLLLTTHEHDDHAGGLAYMQQISGAKLLARPSARTALSTGQPDADDPQFSMLIAMPPVRVDGDLQDGQALAFGGITLTAYATPIHTNGSTSYAWQSCEGEGPDDCVSIAFMDSLSTPIPATYRFADHPHIVQRIQAGFAQAARLSCNLLITPHPSASALWERLAGEKPLLYGKACNDYVAAAKMNFENRLLKEKK